MINMLILSFQQYQKAMSDRNQERNARATMAKQAYLRQHILASDYQDFGQFCQEFAGNTAIEGWSLEFVISLVDQFKKKIAERKELQKRLPEQQKSFYIYQTGKVNQVKDLSQQIKQEVNKNPPNTARVSIKPKQQSALEVLDSIFKKQKPNQFTTNKYDKTQFESRNFWQVNATLEKQKENSKQSSPNFSKNQSAVQATQFASNKLPLEAQKFDKIFTTGLKIPQVKKETRPVSPQIKDKKQVQPNQNKLKEESKPFQTNNVTNSKSNPESTKRNDIKLLSVKNINISKIPYQGEILFPQPFKQSVSCFKSFQRHTLSVKNLKVMITQHQIINRSFFSSDYVIYYLKVMPNNIVCKRNLEDFQKLRKNLENVYPGIRLPYLQKIGLFGSQTSPDNIQKQKKYLTYFLQDLLSHSELKNFRILEDFLTLKDHKQIKRKFQQNDKMNKIKAIQELCLLQQSVKVQISEPVRQYNQHIQALNTKMKIYWNIQQRIFSHINDMHKRIAQNYIELSQAIDNMSKEINDFNRKVGLYELNPLDNALQSLKRYINENVNIHLKQSDLLRDQLVSRIRYERENMNTLDAVSTIRNDLTRNYLKRRDHEKANDNIEYQSQRLKDYKTSIIDESKNITVLKYQCGYINNLMMNEGHHYFQILGTKIQRMVSNVSHYKLETMTKSKEVFSGLVVNF